MAAAVITPSGAPPVPITACTPVPRTAAAMPAERSPSPIRRMRAPASRMSAMSCSWRGAVEDHDGEVARPRARRPWRVLRRFSATGASMWTLPRAVGPTIDLLHVDVGRVEQAAALGGGEHRDGVRRAGGAEVGALERIDGDVDAGAVRAALAARRPPRRRRASAPCRARPRRSRSGRRWPGVSISRRIASTATWSECLRSPRPMVWAAAIAACSVTRMKSCSRSWSTRPSARRPAPARPAPPASPLLARPRGGL